MATLDELRNWMLRSRRTFGAAAILMLLVLGATVTVGWLLARTLIREQISQRDADLLYAATLMEQMDARTANGFSSARSDEQLGFDAAILASRMKGVMGIRFFSAEGHFRDAFPAAIQPADLDAHTLGSIRALQPHSHYRAAALMSDVFIYRPSFATGRIDRIPLLEVTVPLHRRDADELHGAAQFLVEGYSIAAQYRSLDRHLAGLAGQTFLVAGGLLAVVLWIVFHRIEHLNQQLTRQNERLSRANEELAMAARSSALGAISSHLMHGLKNPLASLTRYVREQESGGPANGTREAIEDRRDALAATRRMQALVEHTLEVLSDARGEAAYPISLAELIEAVELRLKPLAKARGVDLQTRAGVPTMISSRVANLTQLVLVNLAENAVQATPRGKRVSLEVGATDSHLLCRVRDEGPGFPSRLRARLFLPCRSSKDGGSGIGLSICKQIADHLGASLELTEPPEGGCLFTLQLPLAAAQPERLVASERSQKVG